MRYFITLALFFTFMSGATAALITEWDFNAESSPGVASIGTGTSAGSSFPFSNTLPNNSGSSNDPGTVITGGLNNANGVRRGPNPGEASGQRTMRFTSSTAGFENINVSWDMTAGYRTSRFYQISATSDGTNFNSVSGILGTNAMTTVVGSASISSSGLITVLFDDSYVPDPDLDTATPVDYLSLSFAFPGGSAFEDNPEFAISIAAVHDPQGSDFVSSFVGTDSTDSTDGYERTGATDTRYDLVRISGVRIIPEPTTSILAFFGLALVCIRRRR